MPRRPNRDSVDTATLELLRSWQLQDATNNPAELSVAEQELIKFKEAMNDNRTASGEPRMYS